MFSFRRPLFRPVCAYRFGDFLECVRACVSEVRRQKTTRPKEEIKRIRNEHDATLCFAFIFLSAFLGRFHFPPRHPHTPAPLLFTHAGHTPLHYVSLAPSRRRRFQRLKLELIRELLVLPQPRLEPLVSRPHCTLMRGWWSLGGLGSSAHTDQKSSYKIQTRSTKPCTKNKRAPGLLLPSLCVMGRAALHFSTRPSSSAPTVNGVVCWVG